MFVTTKNFPQENLTEEQLELLQSSILNEITKIADGDFQPQFHDCFKRRGNLIIVCNNQDSVDWLKKTVPTIKPWETADCHALEPTEVPNLMDILLTLPKDIDTEVLLRRIEKQNENVDTSKWNLTSKKTEEGETDTTYIFAVDESVVTRVRELDYKLFINFNRVHVRYLGALRTKEDKKEKDENEDKEKEEKEGEEVNIDPEEIVGALTTDELQAVAETK